jgi:hypothetical protein
MSFGWLAGDISPALAFAYGDGAAGDDREATSFSAILAHTTRALTPTREPPHGRAGTTNRGCATGRNLDPRASLPPYGRQVRLPHDCGD